MMFMKGLGGVQIVGKLAVPRELRESPVESARFTRYFHHSPLLRYIG